MIDEKYLQSLPKSERLQILQDHADKIETGTYFRKYTEEELNQEREEFTIQCIELDKLEEEKDKIIEEMKVKMKPVKNFITKGLNIIRNKGLTVNETLYSIANHDEGFMESYNEEGELIEKRKLRPDERQTTIKPAQFKNA